MKVFESRYVISGNYEQFARYIKEKRDNIRYIYVRDELLLFGLRNINGTFIGTWYERRDIEAILARLATVSLSLDGIIKARQVLIDKRKEKAYTHTISTPIKGNFQYGNIIDEIQPANYNWKKEYEKYQIECEKVLNKEKYKQMAIPSSWHTPDGDL